MLLLTENATSAIDALVHQPEVPDGAGLRISLADDSGQLALTMAAFADIDDRVIEDAGARVFLDPGAAEVLDDKVLDAQVAEGSVQFLVATQ
ncbi:MAG: hypothetical protein M3Z03_06705 [Actinomycetota bacterium]|nr:hypothetical protein [Actinomycetota bacterium]